MRVSGISLHLLCRRILPQSFIAFSGVQLAMGLDDGTGRTPNKQIDRTTDWFSGAVRVAYVDWRICVGLLVLLLLLLLEAEGLEMDGGWARLGGMSGGEGLAG